jgi:hypothetical protein
LQPKLLGDENFVEGFLSGMAESRTPFQLRDLGNVSSVRFAIKYVDPVMGLHDVLPVWLTHRTISEISLRN